MRIAILTDIHANREALESVLEDIRQRSIDRIVCLGDIVGYGPDPVWCVETMMRLAEKGAVVVKGNHDHAIEDAGEDLNSAARRVIDWTRPQLTPEHHAFLAGLPMIHREGDLLFVHASANSPSDWIYVVDAARARGSFAVCDARAIFCGHRHVPDLMSFGRDGEVHRQRFVTGHPLPLLSSRRWLAVVGSVGQPRDGNPKAAYAIFDTQKNELEFLRVSYDAAKTAAKLRALGLPESLAARLMQGS
ncbi:metallophosphoesterase [Rhizobium sp. AAP43]|uniref:metallophosphoesterase family protein n=1 Tax=Rhizobium sp. AAP43 TaxID=1523420 RepID=UPI0006B97D12|nr:metallophosphoesterase family protein [Rhizobium sp. AAP43]KPF42748.1 metallophosphoesterase [Rhizobium sp. AAP43]